MCLRYTYAAFVILTIAFAASARADDGSAQSDDDVGRLIQQLDSEKFSERQSAAGKLADKGKAAFPALIDTINNGSREASTRALDVLRKHFENGDSETKAAAKEALEQIAAGNDPAIARRAKDVLEPPQDTQQFPALPGGRIRVGQAQIRLQIQAVAPGARRVSIKNVNGVKDIEVQENGRKVKIHDDPNNGIKVEVTEKIDGKEQTKTYEAKNADELKQKHPEAHKIFEQYGQNQGGIQIGVQPGQRPAVVPANRADATDRLKKQLDDVIQRYRQQIENNDPNSENLKRMIEQLEQHKARIDEAHKRIEETRKQIEQQQLPVIPQN